MDFRRHPQHQPSRIGLLCRPALLLADGDVVIDRFTKGALELVDRGSVKPDDILDAGQMADKDTIYLVELDTRRVAPRYFILLALQRTPAT